MLEWEQDVDKQSERKPKEMYATFELIIGIWNDYVHERRQSLCTTRRPLLALRRSPASTT
eukprot:11380367-Heterocapsa_arctica.AAC.1